MQIGQRIFIGHVHAVDSAAFSPDGKAILTSGDDTSVRLWETDYHDLINDFCSRLHRDLTAEERNAAGIQDDEPTCPQVSKQPIATATPDSMSF